MISWVCPTTEFQVRSASPELRTVRPAPWISSSNPSTVLITVIAKRAVPRAVVALTAEVRTVAEGEVERLGEGDGNADSDGGGVVTSGAVVDGSAVGAGAQAARAVEAKHAVARPRNIRRLFIYPLRFDVKSL